jgi:hypothetical protein
MYLLCLKCHTYYLLLFTGRLKPLYHWWAAVFRLLVLLSRINVHIVNIYVKVIYLGLTFGLSCDSLGVK